MGNSCHFVHIAGVIVHMSVVSLLLLLQGVRIDFKCHKTSFKISVFIVCTVNMISAGSKWNYICMIYTSASTLDNRASLNNILQ